MDHPHPEKTENKPERITMKTIFRSILAALNLEKGVFFTIYAFAVKPGQAAREYLYENRSRLVHPLRFLIIFVTLATILTLSILSEEDFANQFEQGFRTGADMEEIEDAELQEFMELYSNNMVVANYKYFNVTLMLSVPLAALGTLLVYRRRQYNFAEHLVINAYLYSNTTVIYLLFAPLYFIFSYFTVSTWYFIAVIPYYCFCCYQIFEPKGFKAILKAVWAFILQGIFVFVFMFILAVGLAGLTAAYGIKLEM